MERLSLITCVGKYHYKCPYKRKGERHSRHRRGKGDVKTEVEIEWCSHQRLEEVSDGFSWRTSKRSEATPSPWFWSRVSGVEILVNQEKNKFLFYQGAKFVVICCNSHRKLTQHVRDNLLHISQQQQHVIGSCMYIFLPLSSFVKHLDVTF